MTFAKPVLEVIRLKLPPAFEGQYFEIPNIDSNNNVICIMLAPDFKVNFHFCFHRLFVTGLPVSNYLV